MDFHGCLMMVKLKTIAPECLTMMNLFVLCLSLLSFWEGRLVVSLLVSGILCGWKQASVGGSF